MNGGQPERRHAQLRLKAVTHWPALPNLDANQESGGRDKTQGGRVGRGTGRNLLESSTACSHDPLTDVSDTLGSSQSKAIGFDTLLMGTTGTNIYMYTHIYIFRNIYIYIFFSYIKDDGISMSDMKTFLFVYYMVYVLFTDCFDP